MGPALGRPLRGGRETGPGWGGGFKCVGFNQATGLVSPLRRQICLSPVWLGGLRYCGFVALSLGLFGVAARALRAQPPNWIQTYLAPRDESKRVGLIESFGAPPQTPRRLDGPKKGHVIGVPSLIV